MPMPRFTSIPALNSRAIRLAMTVCGVMSSSRVANQEVDQGSGGDDLIGRNHANGYDVIGARHDRCTGHRHDGIEVARGQPIGEVAEVVGEERVNQREVSTKRDFNKKNPAIYVDLLLALFNLGADPSRCQYAAEPVAARTDLLDQCAVRHEIDD